MPTGIYNRTKWTGKNHWHSGRKQPQWWIDKRVKGRKGYKHSEETKKKIGTANTKENIGYYGVHSWLIVKFGKATKCENQNCEKKSKKFEWARIKGKSWERKRENYCQLCTLCHGRFDLCKKFKFKLKLKDEFVYKRQR